jgi:hypothetical protein
VNKIDAGIDLAAWYGGTFEVIQSRGDLQMAKPGGDKGGPKHVLTLTVRTVERRMGPCVLTADLDPNLTCRAVVGEYEVCVIHRIRIRMGFVYPGYHAA